MNKSGKSIERAAFRPKIILLSNINSKTDQLFALSNIIFAQMLIDHTSYGIPSKIGPIKIKPLTWKDFKASPPENSPYLAHIYWGVNYQFGNINAGQPKVKVTVSVRPKSWKARENIALLRHQYGHYLIGCLCGLSFSKKVNLQFRWNKKGNFGVWCNQILSSCLRQYCKMQRLYDEQTSHYMNEQMQVYWQNKIRGLLIEFNSFYENRKQELAVKGKKWGETSHNKERSKQFNSVNSKFSVRKDVIANNEKRNSQVFLSNQSLRNRTQHQQKKYIRGSHGNTLARLRQYKKMNSNLEIKGQNTSSFVMRPVTTGFKSH